MSVRPKSLGAAGVGALLAVWIASCTLTSDSYEPREVVAPLEPVVVGLADAGVAPSSPAALEPSSAPTSACPSGSEIAGCALDLLPGACATDADCESRHCRENECQPASCEDGRRNQQEAAVDCGGSGCPPCAAAASCSDGIANGTEPVVDCGDDTCGPCPNGRTCTADTQCASGRCQQGTCRPPLCKDGVRSGSETDADCGGPDAECARCTVGAACATDSDCVSDSCSAGRCSSCGDGERNGSESGLDCGGECGPCEAGATCRADADCQSAACQDGRCCGGKRGDCTRCVRRLVQVLSCSSNGADGAAQCDAFLDCLADNPGVCPVRYAPGCSDDPGGVCNHVAFGGNAGPGVALADAILGTAGCTFGDE